MFAPPTTATPPPLLSTHQAAPTPTRVATPPSTDKLCVVDGPTPGFGAGCVCGAHTHPTNLTFAGAAPDPKPPPPGARRLCGTSPTTPTGRAFPHDLTLDLPSSRCIIPSPLRPARGDVCATHHRTPATATHIYPPPTRPPRRQQGSPTQPSIDKLCVVDGPMPGFACAGLIHTTQTSLLQGRRTATKSGPKAAQRCPNTITPAHPHSPTRPPPPPCRPRPLAPCSTPQRASLWVVRRYN
jgi:hypothetical protein